MAKRADAGQPNPFEKTYTQISTAKQADTRHIETYNFAHIVGKKDEVAGYLERIVGHRDMKQWIHETSVMIPYRKARKKLLDAEAESAFDNAVLAGPPGVGKTTCGIMIGAYLAGQGVLTKPTVYVATVKDLKGEYIGDSEKLMSQLITVARGGLIVIDEVDSLNVVDVYNTALINTLNGSIDKEKDDGTIFVFTGYPDGMQKFMRSNPGLSRRFPNTFYFNHFTDQELTVIFDKVVERRKYHIDDNLRERAIGQILKAKEMMGDDFGNASSVETFVDKMEKKHTSRFAPEDLLRIAEMEEAPQAVLRALQTFDNYDVPVYDKGSKSFKTLPMGDHFQFDLPVRPRLSLPAKGTDATPIC
jgi:SpoVK/Ycf46/Vps4 family AAA+-type ATPase